MGSFSTDYIDVRLYRYKKANNMCASTLNELEYTSDDGKVFKVESGFETNFASTPKLIWNLYPPIDKYTNASILHDWFYSGNGVENRKQADKRFYQACKDSGLNGFSAWIMYIFVRLFAWFAYTSPKGKKGKIDGAGVFGIVLALMVFIALGFGIFALVK